MLGTVTPGAVAADGPAYVTAPGSRAVSGAASTATAPLLEPGSHEDAVAPGERFYQVTLDARSSVYVSAVVRPAPGAEVAYGDGIDVVLMTAGGEECGSSDRGTFGSDHARPITDVAVRRLQEDADCQQAGPYYVKLVRTSDKDSDQAPWPVELTVMREPGLGTGSAPPSAAPSTWPSAEPVRPPGVGEVRAGGTGFNDARALETGVWRDGMHPGQTRFYRIPVEWGRQLSVSAELAKAPRMTKEYGSAGRGLSVSLYNPARALMDTETASYDGKQAMAAFGKTPPVAYDNRFSNDDWMEPAAVAGWYYLAVTVDREVGDFVADAEELPLTLRVKTEGQPAAEPPYREDAVAAGFGVSAEDRSAARDGLTAVEAQDAADRRSLMGTVAAGGIGTGTVLLLGLGAWTLLARRGRVRTG
ncbi:hypothetical protein LG634_00530 [Streptomyces bambusae]|uniref:hypothetical protein n=1 Tax=Streptomyces bambusae TaxID=1550616 RepID=UPI001CFEAF78|nr:hypothetical protein [Streptomyces bambusae]MCB5163341.1 hypothetical protein [Streptomyces bambusae]